jgi:hypothetical protein
MVFSIHNLFLNNQGCAGEVKNVAKLRSGSLMIECFRKQHLWNLLALKYINGINICISPHRTLSVSRGIILYRDDELYGCLAFATRVTVTQQVPLVEQQLLTLAEHNISSLTVYSWICVAQSLVFCVMFCRSLFVLLSFFFWPLYCLSSFDILLLFIPLVSSNVNRESIDHIVLHCDKPYMFCIMIRLHE